MPARSYYSGRLHWTLTVTWAGQTFRWATSPLEIETEAGETLSFDDGLDPIDYEDSLQGLGVASARSIPVEVFFPPEVDVSEWISRGYDLASATGEVALWSEDTVWEERRVVLQGPVREPEYGSIDEPVSFSIEDALQSNRSFVPEISQSVSTETFPDAPEDSLGRAYPLVWGRPGYLEDTTGTIAGSPAVIAYTLATNEKLIVAGHAVRSATVRIFDADNARETFAVIVETDDAGQTVSTVDISSPSFIDPLSSEYYVGWIDQEALVDDAGDAVVTLGQIIVYLLQRSDLPVDVPAWTTLSSSLSVPSSGFIDEQVSAFEWLSDHVFGTVPLSVLPGPEGYYPVLWKLQATRDEAVCMISPDDDPTVEREGRVTYSKLGDVVNASSVRYGSDPLSGDYRRTLTLTSEDVSGVYQEATYYTRLSQALYGDRGDEVELDWAWSRAAASYVAVQQALRSALPSREVSYSVPYSYGWLRLGDVILVTDSEVHLSEEIGLVTGLRWASEEELSARVLLLSRPELSAGVSP